MRSETQIYLWCRTRHRNKRRIADHLGGRVSVFPKAGGAVAWACNATRGSRRGVWPRQAAPYLVLGVASLLTAVLVVAVAGDKLTDYRAAILAGYAWDSTLQKLRR